ncbi:hypothetical protein [Micromonospora zhanjiangensis]|uniref:Transposase, Mutator family n=1 Tax=Micromonospora zhanjiangensis TaxID=1522057 RepID=A0ABV8KHZ6_9ACTN
MTNAHEKLDIDGTLRDGTTEELLRGLLDALADKIRHTALSTATA